MITTTLYPWILAKKCVCYSLDDYRIMSPFDSGVDYAANLSYRCDRMARDKRKWRWMYECPWTRIFTAFSWSKGSSQSVCKRLRHGWTWWRVCVYFSCLVVFCLCVFGGGAFSLSALSHIGGALLWDLPPRRAQSSMNLFISTLFRLPMWSCI